MHKHCFRCCECNNVLKLAAFAYNGGKFYWCVLISHLALVAWSAHSACSETHFQQLFKKGSGYNF
jgi:AraC-like DNA-binding protein